MRTIVLQFFVRVVHWMFSLHLAATVIKKSFLIWGRLLESCTLLQKFLRRKESFISSQVTD